MMPSISSTIRNHKVGAIALLGVLVATTAIAAPGPRDVVKRMADNVLVVLKDKSATSDGKRERIEQIVYAGIDFDTLCRLVLARNWTRFSPEEQGRFEDEFKRHLSVTYGKSVDSYRNEEMSIISDHEEARGDWTVKTKILRGGGPDDILVDYRLRQSNGEWKIIDVIVEGVSLVSNFRSQFQDLLGSNTPAQLIALIHDKNARGESFPGAPKPKT
jgi:phospholipid transport system substrate-binding protein